MIVSDTGPLVVLFKANLSLKKKALPKKPLFLVKVFAKQKSL